MLDGVYRLTGGVPVFQAVPAPTTEELQVVLRRIITRLMKVLTRKGFLIEEEQELNSCQQSLWSFLPLSSFP